MQLILQANNAAEAAEAINQSFIFLAQCKKFPASTAAYFRPQRNELFIQGELAESVLWHLTEATNNPTKQHEYELKASEGGVDLEKLAASLIWLDPFFIDLESPTCNAGMAILVRIEKAHYCYTRTGRQPRSMDAYSLAENSEAFDDFQRLMTDFSLSWDGNINQRKHVDPDTYAIELQRAERCRLRTREFPFVLLNLISSIYTREGSKDLFILPVVTDGDSLSLNVILGATIVLAAPSLVTIIACSEMIRKPGEASYGN